LPNLNFTELVNNISLLDFDLGLKCAISSIIIAHENQGHVLA